jgi:D-sedoheptulose 7-phosphate isomerase
VDDEYFHLIKTAINSSVETIENFSDSCIVDLTKITKLYIDAFKSGRKLLICGNGGSASDSQHLAAEFVSSFGFGLSRRSLPAIALTTDSSILTAISNDFGYKYVFARQIEGLGQAGDVLLTLSTSGESENCLEAVKVAKEINMISTAFTKEDSTLARIVDYSLKIPSSNTQHIQECHIISYHIIAGLVDRAFMKEKPN